MYSQNFTIEPTNNQCQFSNYMKKMLSILLGAVLLLPIFNVVGQAVVKYGSFTKTITGTTAAQLVTTNLYVKTVTLRGQKSARTDNSDKVYIGWTSTDDTQAFPIAVGGEIVIEAGGDRQLNLKDIYLDVLQSGDGVVVFYK